MKIFAGNQAVWPCAEYLLNKRLNTQIKKADFCPLFYKLLANELIKSGKHARHAQLYLILHAQLLH